MAQIFKPLYSAFPSKDEITNKMFFVFVLFLFCGICDTGLRRNGKLQ